jgi:hypothetical protein
MNTHDHRRKAFYVALCLLAAAAVLFAVVKQRRGATADVQRPPAQEAPRGAAEPARKPAQPIDRAPQPLAATANAASTPSTTKDDAPPDAAAPAGHAPTRPVSTRPKADREFTADGVEKITFDDLILGMQADMVFRPWMLEVNDGRARELEGKRIRLPGVMWGGVKSGKNNKEFVLLRNKECKFGPGGQADHVAVVKMKEGHTADYTPDTVRVEGTLAIEPSQGDDGNTWYIYVIKDAVLK